VADRGLLATCPMVRASIALNSAQSVAGLMHQRAIDFRSPSFSGRPECPTSEEAEICYLGRLTPGN